MNNSGASQSDKPDNKSGNKKLSKNTVVEGGMQNAFPARRSNTKSASETKSSRHVNRMLDRERRII